MQVRKTLKIILLLTVIFLPVYYFRSDFTLAWQKIKAEYFYRPCFEPIAYRIGTIDERFGLSPEELLSAVKEAENLWENASNRDLFEYADTGALAINLVYDFRQDTTEKLSSIDEVLTADKGEFEKLNADYDQNLKNYNIKLTSLNALIATYNKEASAYENEVRRYNRRGGASQEVYDELMAKREDLNKQVKIIRAAQTEVENLAKTVNDLAHSLNSLISEYNLNVGEYNSVGASLPDEFEQGNYTGSFNMQAINIYQFNSRDKLVRVLAHEMGHALGIEHIFDSEDIMYGLNIGQNDKISEADLSALSEICSAPTGLEKFWLNIKNFFAFY